MDYVVNTDSVPSGLGSAEVGLSAGRRTGGLDWSASYFYGHDRVPSSYIVRPPPAMESEDLPASEMAVEVEIFPRHRRLHTVGLDGETTLGAFGIRGEASYTRYDDVSETLPRSFAMFAAGADRTFFGIVGSHVSTSTCNTSSIPRQLRSRCPASGSSPTGFVIFIGTPSRRW